MKMTEKQIRKLVYEVLEKELLNETTSTIAPILHNELVKAILVLGLGPSELVTVIDMAFLEAGVSDMYLKQFADSVKRHFR